MPVEQDRLNLREQRVALVQVPPARLHDRQPRVAEVRHGPPEEVARRHEVGVEDRDELAARRLESCLERAGLVPDAVRPVDVLDVESARGLAPNGELGDVARLVGRIVEDLNLEELERVVDRADRVDEPIDDVHLVVDRQLDGDDRPLTDRRRRARDLVLVLQVLVDDEVAVPPVDAKDTEDEEVGN